MQHGSNCKVLATAGLCDLFVNEDSVGHIFCLMTHENNCGTREANLETGNSNRLKGQRGTARRAMWHNSALMQGQLGTAPSQKMLRVNSANLKHLKIQFKPK